MISLRDTFNDKYWLSFNSIVVNKSDWKILDELDFDCNEQKSNQIESFFDYSKALEMEI